jgi:hypothetical protein
VDCQEKKETTRTPQLGGVFMAINLQVGCVRKGARSEPHGRILGIGGKYANGSSWYLSEAEAIERIQKDKWKFYVSTGVKRVKVKVAECEGRGYLRTDPVSTPDE